MEKKVFNKNFDCNYCNKLYSSVSSLNNHMSSCKEHIDMIDTNEKLTVQLTELQDKIKDLELKDVKNNELLHKKDAEIIAFLKKDRENLIRDKENLFNDISNLIASNNDMAKLQRKNNMLLKHPGK